MVGPSDWSSIYKYNSSLGKTQRRLQEIVFTKATDEISMAYEYDEAGRVTRLSFGPAFKITYVYDSAGNLVQKIYGEGKFKTEMSYYEFGLVKNISHVLSSTGTSELLFDYEYDIQGNPTKMNTVDREWTFGYDVVGRLTDASATGASNVSFEYSYDRSGNRIAYISEAEGVNQVGVFDSAERISTIGSNTFTYDSNARVIEESGRYLYSYDAKGQLSSLTDQVVSNNCI